MLIFGIDPGFSGAWGVVTHTGKYHTCGDMIHNGHSLDTEAVWSEMLLARDGQGVFELAGQDHARKGLGAGDVGALADVDEQTALANDHRLQAGQLHWGDGLGIHGSHLRLVFR